MYLHLLVGDWEVELVVLKHNVDESLMRPIGLSKGTYD